MAQGPPWSLHYGIHERSAVSVASGHEVVAGKQACSVGLAVVALGQVVVSSVTASPGDYRPVRFYDLNGRSTGQGDDTSFGQRQVPPQSWPIACKAGEKPASMSATTSPHPSHTDR